MRTISMRLPDDLLTDLNREAKARRVPKSSIVRDSLEKTLRSRTAQTGSCFDLAADLAGSVKGLPKNLARDPKFMDGFGE